MKKIFFSILAVAALASCMKSEAVYTEDNSEIKIAPVTSLATKTVYGAIDGTSYPTAEEFVVNAYWNGTTQYLTDVVFANKGQYWGGQNATYYWPKNGSLEFACYSPETVTGLTYTYPNTWTGSFSQSESTAETTDLLFAPLTKPYTAQTATENVSVVFEHALSWITIKVKAANADAAKAFTIHDIIIEDAYKTGTLNANMADGFKYDDWAEEKTNATDYKVVSNGNITLGTSAVIVEDAPQGTVLLPQVPTTLTINFTQNALTDGEVATTPELKDQTVNVPLELDDETNNIWEPGKHYIYTVTFDLEEILINPSVVDWEDVIVEDKPFDGAGQIATVANETELLAALEAEVAEIELTAEVELTAALELDYNVAITGGGFAGKPINVTGGVVSFENVAFANGTTGTESAVYVRNGNTNVTFQNCTFDEYAYEAIQYVSEDGLWVCVDGCTFNAAAHRDLHLQVKNASKAEVKITNNTFKGDDADSYVTVYGFDMERMILANNVTETPANYVNVWISDLFDDTKLTIEGFAFEGSFVTTNEELAAALRADKENISVALSADIDLPIASLGQQTGGSGEYKLGGESTKTITIDLGGKTLNITTTYWSGIGAKNADAKIVIKNGTMTSSQATGTWNSYDLTFANCNYEFVNVEFSKAIAFTNANKTVVLNDVTINETHDYYAMWISAKGQDVKINGLTINSTGRGIKIDEQYVDAPAKVTMKVENATFKTAKKAAILVKSVAGAAIALNNVDITATPDTVNAVWVDADAAASADKVTVTGGNVIVEP